MIKNLRNSVLIFLFSGLVGCGPSKFLQQDSWSPNKAKPVPSLAVPTVDACVHPAKEEDSLSACGLILCAVFIVSGLVAAFCYPSRFVSCRDWLLLRPKLAWAKIKSLRKK